MRILLIAGHGQGDSGAVGYGHKEADLTREFVKLIKQRLPNSEIFNTDLSMCKFLRAGNNFNFKNYDYVLEIHFNAGGGTGSEIILHSRCNEAKLENNILDKLSHCGLRNRGVKRSNELLVMNTCATQGVPYSLFEVGFIDSEIDMALYGAYKNKYADIVAQCIFDTESEDEIMLKELAEKYGENAVKSAIEELITARQRDEWKIQGSDYLHAQCSLSSTHDQSEPVTFGILGTILSKFKGA